MLDIATPVADSGKHPVVTEGMVVTFNGSASIDNVAIVNYTWTFSYNGGTVMLYGVSPTFNFDTAGSYTVTLNVTDGAGNWDTDTIEVTVNEGKTVLIVISVLLLVILFLIVLCLAIKPKKLKSKKS